MKTRIAIGIFLIGSLCYGFIPPISEQLNDVFAGRKGNEALELTFRHQVQVKEGEFVEVIETFIGNRSGGLIQFQIGGQPAAYADWTGKEYVFRNGKTIPSRTAAFIDYFLADSGAEFQDRLLRERFLRRDQLLQFKPGYQPKGDPKTWETKDNYLNHDDISWQKGGKEFAVSVVGMNEGDQRRAFYIAKGGRGITRLEWIVGPEKASWDFSGFAATGGLGKLPRVFSLQINSMERVRSALSSAKPVKRDALATARAASKQPSASAPPSELLEQAVRLLVRYR